MKTDHAIAPSRCLACGAALVGAFAVVGDAAPTEGDASACIECGHMMVFDADGKLRNPTADESARLNADFRVHLALMAIQRAKRNRNRRH